MSFCWCYDIWQDFLVITISSIFQFDNSDQSALWVQVLALITGYYNTIPTLTAVEMNWGWSGFPMILFLIYNIWITNVRLNKLCVFWKSRRGFQKSNMCKNNCLEAFNKSASSKPLKYCCHWGLDIPSGFYPECTLIWIIEIGLLWDNFSISISTMEIMVNTLVITYTQYA